MADITAKLVAELRERTGAGMMDCKRALVATEGDIEAAAEKMRTDGMVKADKKASRVAAEGRVVVAQNDSALALVEVNCETDFVAKADDFMALANAAAQAALQQRPASIEALMQLTAGDSTLDEIRRGLVAKIGENITVRRMEVLNKAGGALSYYLHGSKIGVAVSLEAGSAELARDLAMHIAASNPLFLDASAIPAESLAQERRLIEATVATEQANDVADGKKAKPAEILAKMVDGKVNRYIAENTLLGQPFVKNPDQTIEALLKSQNAKVAKFVRVVVGEGIEKKETDFAAEVAAAVQAA